MHKVALRHTLMDLVSNVLCSGNSNALPTYDIPEGTIAGVLTGIVGNNHNQTEWMRSKSLKVALRGVLFVKARIN